MLEITQQSRSPALNETETECLQYLRSAIASNDRQTAIDIKNVLADVCQRGHADRAAIWADLTQTEQQQFQELLGPPPLAREAGPENQGDYWLSVAGCGWCGSD
jgi:hypothetical protein